MSTPHSQNGSIAPSVTLTTATAIAVADMVGTGVFTSLGFQVPGIPSGFSLLMLWVMGGGRRCRVERAWAAWGVCGGEAGRFGGGRGVGAGAGEGADGSGWVCALGRGRRGGTSEATTSEPWAWHALTMAAQPAAHDLSLIHISEPTRPY